MDASVDAQAKLNAIVADDRAKGAVVHSFNPDDSPSQKAAEAGKTSLNLIHAPDTPAVVLSTSPAGPPSVPTIAVQDLSESPKEAQFSTPTVQPPDDVPGTYPKNPAAPVPDWYRTGWRAVAGVDDIPDRSPDAIANSVIQLYLGELYYGQWYHNAAIIIFAVVATHILTRLRMGWGWLIIVLAFCATYYQTSIRRVRRHARDDIQRELIKTRLVTESESADWLNNFLDRFWLIYEPVLSKTIVATVDQILSASTPAFLDSIRLDTFTLGTKAPRIDSVRTDPTSDRDVVLMDWSIKFTPSDTTDVTPRQLKNQVNPKIVLAVRLGKGLATAAMPILLEDLSFQGKMRIKLKLIPNFPHIQLFEMSFLQKPEFDYVLKPIGGETFGWDIGNIPGLSAFINDMVHATLQPMMYDPNSFTLNLEQLLSGAPIDSAIGVLQIHVSSARNLKGGKMGAGTPDPYVSFSISNRASLAKTVHKRNTSNPHWSSTHFILLNASNMSEILTLTVFDHNERLNDTELGAATFELGTLLKDASQDRILKDVVKDGKERGQIAFDVSFYPVIKPAIVDGKPEPLPETSAGICRLVLHQAKDLDSTVSLSGDLNPLAKVFLSSGSSTVPHHVTKVFKHTNSPVWESPTEFLVPNKKNSVVRIKVVNDRGFRKDPVIGYMNVDLETLLEGTRKRASGGGEPWFALSGCKSGKVRISAEWKPLNMAGSLQGAGTYSPPIGLVRLWIKKAENVKNPESTLGGKSDPYVRVLLNGVVQARTDVINNNLNPEWDQIIYVPVHSLRESMVLECMDYQNIGKDRPLGQVEVRVDDLAAENSDTSASHEYRHMSKGKMDTSTRIQVDKNTYIGTLFYTAEFIPSLNLSGLVFDGENELEKAVHKGNHGDPSSSDEVPSGDEESVSSSDEEYEKVPEGITIKRAKHVKNAMSTDTTATVATMDTSKTTQTTSVANDDPPSVTLPKAELLQSQAGIIIFKVQSGSLAKKARVEVLLDDSYWPAFSTFQAQSTNAKWDQIGEGFIKELDFSRVWIRLNENDEGEKEDIIGELKMDAKQFLNTCLDQPTEFALNSGDGRYASKVTISAKFVPVPIKLDPRESMNNMGSLRVDLLDGKDIHGADRSGKSDPFVVFTLNDNRVFKSEVKKKTLTPVWNQNFTVMVPSRVASSFALELFDWNQIEQAKSLGAGNIDLGELEPFQPLERNVTINSTKHGERGSVRVRLLFTPEIIAKARKNTSTFSVAGRAMTQIGAVPLGAGAGVVQGVGSVGKKAFGVLGGRKERTTGESTLVEEEPSSQDLPPPPTSSLMPLANGSHTGLSVADHSSTSALSPPETGTLRVAVLGAKDLSLHGESSVKPYLVLRNGKEEFKTKHTGKTLTPEWDEVFTIQVGPETRVLNTTIYDHKTIGRDKTLGEVDIDIWKHVQSTGQTTADVWLALRDGNGSLHIKIDYERANGASIGRVATGPSSRGVLSSPSRFSITQKDSR